MSPTIKILLVILFSLIHCTAFCEPNGHRDTCAEKTSTKTSAYSYKGVRCKMILSKHQDKKCKITTPVFKTILTQRGMSHMVTCTKLSDILAGTRYSCEWETQNGGSKTQQLDWMALGKGEWTCQHIINWVLATP